MILGFVGVRVFREIQRFRKSSFGATLRVLIVNPGRMRKTHANVYTSGRKIVVRGPVFWLNCFPLILNPTQLVNTISRLGFKEPRWLLCSRGSAWRQHQEAGISDTTHQK